MGMRVEKAADYSESLQAAKNHFGYKYFSPKRAGIYAAMFFLGGIITSWLIDPVFLLSSVVLLEWFISSNAAREKNPEERLEKLVKSSSKVSAAKIAEDFLSRSLLSLYGRKGIREMAAESLAQLEEKDPEKFDSVLEKLEGSKDGEAEKILKKYDEIHFVPFAYRSRLGEARSYFSYAYLSARRIARNAVATLLLVHYTPVDDFWGLDINSSPLAWCLGTIGVYTAGSLIADLLGTIRTSRQANPDQLLNDLVRASMEVEASTIAKDLVLYHRRGLKIMGKEYLLRLKEACGAKFNAVIALLQQSRRGGSLAFAETIRSPACRLPAGRHGTGR